MEFAMLLKLSMIVNILNIIHTIGSKYVCKRVKIGDQWFEKELLLYNIGRPYHLNVLKSTNTLFFSYSLQEMYSDTDFQLACLNIDRGLYHTVAGISGGCTTAIDQDHDEVYLGGSDGIYKYNLLTYIADEYKEKGKNIWSLFYRRSLFYISYPTQKLYILIEDQFSIVKEFENIEIDIFYVTYNNDIYFTNKTGLYKYDNEYNNSDILSDLIVVRQIAEDNEGKIYLCTNLGIYILSQYEGLRKIWDIKSMYGLTFDKDNNLIYSDATSIYRLKKSDHGCEHVSIGW